MGHSYAGVDAFEERYSEENSFYEDCGYLPLSYKMAEMLEKTEAGCAAVAAHDDDDAGFDKIMNPTLCDQSSGKFLDAQGPLSAFDPDDIELELQFGAHGSDSLVTAILEL